MRAKSTTRLLSRLGNSSLKRPGFVSFSSTTTKNALPIRYRPSTSRQGDLTSSDSVWQRLDGEAGRGKLINENHVLTLHPIILRDGCHCSQCVDTSTGQREFAFSDIPLDIEAIPRKTENGDWEITWKNDIPGFQNHVSVYTSEQVAHVGKYSSRILSNILESLWTKDEFASRARFVPFKEFMEEDSGLAKILLSLRRDGLVFVTDVPSDVESVARIVERIGPLRNTFYGRTWDVRSVVDSKNVAYTHKSLGFHMDLLYMDTVPAFQFLHCIHNSCSGGESRFVDTYKAMDVLLSEDPECVQELERNKILYHYENDGFSYQHARNVFQPNKTRGTRRFTGVTNGAKMSTLGDLYWSPPFIKSTTLMKDPSRIKSFVSAAKKFAEILDRKSLVYELKMEEGVCSIFNNTRVAHARNAFDFNQGQRWLRGAYMDKDDFVSRILNLQEPIKSLLEAER